MENEVPPEEAAETPPEDLAAAEQVYRALRERMVQEQLIARGIQDQRVLAAMRHVPRHRFVPAEYRHLAYADGPLPIGAGQTISQPYVVALMTQLLELQGPERVLEIGTGSGYQTAVLAELVAEVYTVEYQPILAEQAQERLQALGYRNVWFRQGDGSLGWQEHAPYDAVLVTAAAPDVPLPLREQTMLGGRLVLPVGGRWGQRLERWRHLENDGWLREHFGPVAFVPLRGQHGWQEDFW